MTADGPRPDALRHAAGQTGATAGNDAREAAAGQPGAKTPHAARRNDSDGFGDDLDALTRSRRLVFVCGECGEQIDPRDGVVAVNVGLAMARARAIHDHRNRAKPPRSPWRFLHQACHDDDRDGRYVQPLWRIKNVGQLLTFTLVIGENFAWVRHTDWRRSVVRLLKAQASLCDLGNTP